MHFFEIVWPIGCGERATGIISNGVESRYKFNLEGEVGTIVCIHVYENEIPKTPNLGCMARHSARKEVWEHFLRNFLMQPISGSRIYSFYTSVVPRRVQTHAFREYLEIAEDTNFLAQIRNTRNVFVFLKAFYGPPKTDYRKSMTFLISEEGVIFFFSSPPISFGIRKKHL